MREFVGAPSGHIGGFATEADVPLTRVQAQEPSWARATRYREVERRLFEAAGIEPRELRISLRRLGADARVLDVGTGEPTLFLHGGPNAAATWSYLAASTLGLRCLLLDRPGTGLSAPLAAVPGTTTLGRVQEDLTVDVLDALGINRAHLVGSSLGGFAALRSAAAHPDRVLRVVLLGCPAFVPGWRQPRFFKLLRTPVLGRAVRALPPTPASVRMSLRELGHRASLRAGKVPAPMLGWIRAWQADTDTMRNDAAIIVRCGTWRQGFHPSLDLGDDILSTVHAPTLVVAGTDDPVGGEEVARGLAGRLPRAEVEVIDDAGHLPWLDDPDRAAELTSTFLTRVVPMSMPTVRATDASDAGRRPPDRRCLRDGDRAGAEVHSPQQLCIESHDHR